MCRLEFRFQNLPFSKSAGKKCAVFVRTEGLSVEFVTVFKMCRHRVNAVSDTTLFPVSTYQFVVVVVVPSVLIFEQDDVRTKSSVLPS